MSFHKIEFDEIEKMATAIGKNFKCLRTDYDQNLQGPCSSGGCQWPNCLAAALPIEGEDK